MYLIAFIITIIIRKYQKLLQKKNSYKDLLEFIHGKNEIIDLYDFQQYSNENICLDDLPIDENSTILYPDDTKAYTINLKGRQKLPL